MIKIKCKNCSKIFEDKNYENCLEEGPSIEDDIYMCPECEKRLHLRFDNIVPGENYFETELHVGWLDWIKNKWSEFMCYIRKHV